MTKKPIRRPTPSPGPELALLLLGCFRTMVDAASAELSRCGHPDVRVAHEFAMRAVEGGAGSAVELARQLGVSKQAAAKTIAVLELRGYITRAGDPKDGRRKRLVLTERGQDMLTQGQAIFDDLRLRWAERVGEPVLMQVERTLRELVDGSMDASTRAAWLAGDEG